MDLRLGLALSVRQGPYGEAPLQPLDLVGGDAHREAKPVLFVAAAHDLGVFIEPVQPLPIAGVKGQFEFRPAASQAILDRRYEMIDPLPRRRRDGERRRVAFVSCSRASMARASASSRSTLFHASMTRSARSATPI